VGGEILTGQRHPQTVVPALRLLYFLLLAFWTGVFFLIIVSSLPYNPSSIGPVAERDIKTTVPEGWGFFTRDPREADVTLYEQHQGVWRRSLHMPIANASNLFGIDRLPRAQSVEMGMILSELDEQDAWRACDGDLVACLNTAPRIALRQRWKYPVLRGTFAFVKQEPVPWAWAASRDRITMPRLILVTSLQ
jgi:antimicrobial peptide system SdpA family protein